MSGMPNPFRPSTRPVRRLVLGALLVGTWIAGAGCGGGDEGGLVVSPAVLDWGRVLHGERQVRELTLRNTSRHAIYVNEVKANCKCVQPGPFQRNLKPGEERRVQVTLETSTLPIGELKGKKLDILSSDQAEPHRQTEVRATVYRTHRIAPEQRLDVGRLAGERRQETWRVLIRPVGDARVKLVRALVTPPGLFDVATEVAEAGQDLILSVAEGATGQGAVRAQLAVELEIEENGKPRRHAVERIRVDGSW